ncbi:endonuclease/exonuclease/phosphatase family protein [Ekhidna sp.]
MRFIIGMCFSLFMVASMAQPIKVISFNIRMATESDGNNQWELRKSSVVDFLSYEEADFVGMQEVLLKQMQDLSTLKDYKSIGVARDDGKEKGEFSPIFYLPQKWKLVDSGTFWLSETPDNPSKSWDAALPRICTWGKFKSIESDTEVFVFNTHFDHVGKEARANSAQLIVDEIRKKSSFKNTILLGDFNVEEGAKPMINITESPLIDSHGEAEIKFGQTGTFNGFNYTKIPIRRIDYVFVTEDFKVEKYGVDSRIIDGRYLSDHFPVVVQLLMR